jgi:hypothetical protein
VSDHVDTVDVGGLAFRVACHYPKPSFWARSRPQFLTAGPADVTVHIAYDDDFRRRSRLPADTDTFSDVPSVRATGRELCLATPYYRATADVERGRVSVRIAAGFGVANLMRTLAALWLLERGTVLLRAVRLGRDGSLLACGIPPQALRGPDRIGVSGYLAVTPSGGSVTTRLTPFLDGERRLRALGATTARRLLVPRAGATRTGGPAHALGVLLPAIWQADRRRAAVDRTLDLATRIVAGLRCRDIEVSERDVKDTAVG